MVLGKTPSVARHIVMVRGDLNTDVVNNITAVLLKMDSTSEGQAVLKTFEKTSKFDEFPEGTTAALNRMREMYKLIQQNDLSK